MFVQISQILKKKKTIEVFCVFEQNKMHISFTVILDNDRLMSDG